MAKHITIEWFETTKISGQTLARNLQDFSFRVIWIDQKNPCLCEERKNKSKYHENYFKLNS
jgi:hypothetical protein